MDYMLNALFVVYVVFICLCCFYMFMLFMLFIRRKRRKIMEIESNYFVNRISCYCQIIVQVTSYLLGFFQ